MIIKGAMICDANGEYRGDVRIQEGKIAKVARSVLAEDGEEIFDASGLLLLPSAIDLNARVQDSQLNKKHLMTLSHKAAKGGVGTLALMPDCTPSLNSEVAMELLNTLQNDFHSQILGIAGSTKAIKENGTCLLNDLSILHKKGAYGIYTHSSEDGNLLKRACEFALMLDIPIFLNCEDESLSANGVMNDGELSARLGLPSISNLSEIKEVAMMSEIVRFMGVRAIFQAIATDRSVEILFESKKHNPNLFVQTSIHHLMLTEDLCEGYNTAAKIKPPLKSESTRAKLVKRLVEGKIELISALQSEKSIAQKDLAFEEAAFGVDMIEYFVPMCYTLLVKNQHLSLKEMSKILSFNPAKALNLATKGLIAEGYDADIVLLNPKETQIIDKEDSPYYNWVLNSKIEKVFHCGKKIIGE